MRPKQIVFCKGIMINAFFNSCSLLYCLDNLSYLLHWHYFCSSHLQKININVMLVQWWCFILVLDSKLPGQNYIDSNCPRHVWNLYLRKQALKNVFNTVSFHIRILILLLCLFASLSHIVCVYVYCFQTPMALM